MKFIAQKLSDGKNQRKLSLYCQVLQVSRQGFYDYLLQRRNRPWKYGPLAEEMRQILSEGPMTFFAGSSARMHL